MLLKLSIILFTNSIINSNKHNISRIPLRLAQNARKEAEKKALEAVKESERIDEEMKLRLSQLKK